MRLVQHRAKVGNIASKFEGEVKFELQPNFREKSVMLQAKIKAGCIRTCLMEKHVSDWKAKPQHGAFFRKLESIAGVDMKGSVSWLSTCHLTPCSESYILAAQDLALTTKYHEKHIMKEAYH